MQEILKKHRQEIADTIIKKMEDAMSWKKPWLTASEPPYNVIAQKKYRGSNRLYLSMFGYNDPRWMTFKQLKDKGYYLQAGSKGAKIEYYRIYDKETKKDLDLNWWQTLTLDQRKKYEENLQFVYRYSVVFNGSCIHGLEPWKQNVAEVKVNITESIQSIADNMGITIYSDDGSKAFYVPKTDEIHLPQASSFWDQSMYDATMLHELAHATGHPTRLNRDLSGQFGSENYANEELRAEISSFFVSQELGCSITTQVTDNHVAYLQSWIKAIQADNTVLFKAIKDSDSIADYMISKCLIKNEIQIDDEELEI